MIFSLIAGFSLLFSLGFANAYTSYLLFEKKPTSISKNIF